MDEHARRRKALLIKEETENKYDDFKNYCEEVDKEILDVYEDTDSESELPSKQRHDYPRKTSIITQGAVWCIIFALIGVFLYLVNVYNMKQLQRLKEEYGHDVKRPHADVWWGKALIYHIIPQTFQDSDGDGIGDINGIRKRISYLSYLGIDAVLISSIHKSPMLDWGKDVTDFTAIDPVFGTLEDWDNMLKEFHEIDIKVILEIVPNQTSLKHKWFMESRKGGGKENQFKNYYVWHPGRSLPNGTKVPPSNWLSRYGGPAWTWDELRNEYYFHQFHKDMPDLNHRDSGLREKMLKMLQFWVETGIDGLLIEGVHILLESDDVELDEPVVEPIVAQPWQHEYLEHIYTEDNHDVHEFMATYREFVDSYAIKSNKKLFLGLDFPDNHLTDIMKFYYTGADAPFNYILSNIDNDCNARCVQDWIDRWLQEMPDGRPVVWSMSNHKFTRLAKKKGYKYQNALNMLLLTIPGSAVTYYGEEIGMVEPDIPFEESKDLFAKSIGQNDYHKYSRDPARTPMQWSTDKHGGFTNGDKPWLPLNNDFLYKNVEVQTTGEENSTPLHVFKTISKVRKELPFQIGKFQFSLTNDNVISYLRYCKDQPPYLVTINFGNASSKDDYTLTVGMEFGEVVATTGKVGKAPSPYKLGGQADLKAISLEPGDGVVIKIF